jgi:hypothetical protein
MSKAVPNTLPPCAASAAAVSATWSALREQNATSAPSAANSSTVARPMPRLPPVRITFFPFNPRSMVFFLVCAGAEWRMGACANHCPFERNGHPACDSKRQTRRDAGEHDGQVERQARRGSGRQQRRQHGPAHRPPLSGRRRASAGRRAQGKRAGRFANAHQCHWAPCDITAEASLAALANAASMPWADRHCRQRHRLGPAQPFLDTTREELDTITALQYVGPFQFYQAMIRKMARSQGGSGGSLIQISSATATIMLNDHAAYMGTKAGTDHVVRCVAHEFGHEGIRANSISPASPKRR